MKKLYLLLLFLALAGVGMGQTTIFTEDFDNNTQYSVTLGGEGNDGSSDYFQRTDGTNIGISYSDYNGTYFFAGQDIDDGGWTGSASPSQLTWSNINISTYSNLQFKGLFGSAATSKIDDNDYLHVEYRIDGGSWTNLIWFENDGSQYNTYFLEDTDFNGDGDGTQLHSTLAEFTKSISPTGSTLDLRFTAAVNSGGEDFAIDYFRILGTASSSNDQTTEVYEPSPQIAAATISSLADTPAEAVDVFKMTIEDQGGGDGLPTHVTNIRVQPHSTNTADWTNTIQGVTLNDGSAVTIGTPTITDTYIDIPITSGNLDIPDGGSKDVTLAVYLNTSNIVDGDVLSFFVDADNHGFTADASGSGFVSTFSLGDFNSNDFTIDVEATQLTFTQQPGNVIVNTVMTPSVKVAYSDVNGNTDVDYDGSGFTIGLTTTGTFDASATTSVDAVNGISTFDNLIFSSVATGVTITANDNSGMGNTSVTSNTFDIKNPQKVIIARNCDPTNNYVLDRFAEIYNAGNSSVDLSGWTLENIQNGSVAFTWTLSGTIDPGQTKVCGNDSVSGQTITPDFTATWSGDSWNGKGSDGTILKDNNGEVIDNAVQSDATGTFENKEMKRKLSITSPNSTYTASEWIFSAVADALDVVPGFHGTVWRGTGTVWTTSNNWDAEVPTSTADVTIPSGVSTYPSIDNSISSPATCNNLTIASGASLTIPAGKALTVSGDLNNNATAADLVIQSDNSGNGSLIVNGTVTGNATVQRYIAAYTGATNGWHEIGSPVDMNVSGSDFDPGTNDDLYYWNESTNEWTNYKQGAFSFTQGSGYLVAYETTATKNFTGTLTASDKTYSNLSYTASSGRKGWHLLGNPYTSAILWNNGGWTFTNVSQTCAVWDETGGTYNNPSNNDPIPASNGFFVEVTSGTNTLTIPASARSHNTQNNYKSEEKNLLKLTVTSDANSYYNSIRVGFKPDATEAWDIRYDAHKLYGYETAPELWTVSNSEEFAVNMLPYDLQPVDLPLYFKAGTDANYTITIDGMNSFSTLSDIYLEDVVLGKTINVKEQPVYDFSATTNDATNRFVLHFYNVTSTPEMQKQEHKALIYAYGHNIVLKANSGSLNGRVEVTNVLGQTVQVTQLTNQSFVRLDAAGRSGIYIIRYKEDNGYVQTQKVIVQ